MQVVAGSYDKAVFGFQYESPTAQDGAADTTAGSDPRLVPTFGYAAHTGCVKAVASSGTILVSSSTDESIKIYNLKKKVEIGSLLQHNGPVTCLDLYKRANLLSGSEDKTICIWSVKGWECLHVLKGHKGALYSLSIHPSGKLAISSAKDSTIRLWDLVKGRSAHCKNLAADAEIVKWNYAGDYYAVVKNTSVSVHAIQKDEALAKITVSKRVLAIDFLQDGTLVTAGEDRILQLWDPRTSQVISSTAAAPHVNRIRGLAVTTIGSDSTLISTGSSDGAIRIWDRRALDSPLCERDTKQRITCLTATIFPRKGEVENRHAKEGEGGKDKDEAGAYDLPQAKATSEGQGEGEDEVSQARQKKRSAVANKKKKKLIKKRRASELEDTGVDADE
mmetsp:Transcript_34250/g.57508  ORF Transcript_34250/g.57508 Transcript_34250/m.57508 type:complete len:391 (+) Transcript_34250:37-1209(+)